MTTTTAPQQPGWPTQEDTQRALDITRRLASYRRGCLYDSETDAQAAADFTD